MIKCQKKPDFSDYHVSDFFVFFSCLMYLQGVRIVWVYHITWLVNSACHVWGKQAWNTGDLSKNNW